MSEIVRPLPERIARSTIAGLLGGLEGALILVAIVIVGVVLLRAGFQYSATGTFTLLPPSPPRSSGAAGVAVLDATPAEAAAIRRAIASLQYRLAPGSVTFRVVDQAECLQCGGDFVAGLDLIEIDRSVIDLSNPLLGHAVAHEIGHYVDARYLTDAQREQFMRLRHIPSSLSWQSADRPWQDRPNEDFAEVFAVLAMPNVQVAPETSYGRVQDPAPFRTLLRTAGVAFGTVPTQQTWRSIADQEYAFFRDMSSQTVVRLELLVLLVVYILWGAVAAFARTWRS